MKISIIIPTYNESEFLKRTLSRIKETSQENCLEVIVVDGGSQDGTAAFAENLADKVLISKKPGRSIQLHEGALAATGDILLFLHADCRLPDQWQSRIETVYSSKNPPVASAFRKKFDKDSPLYKFIARGSAFRQWFTNTPHGDQAITVPKELYFQIGGFPPVDLMEEYHLAEKLRRHGKIQFLPDEVVVSARRYEKNGPLFHAFRNAVIVLLHYLGVSSKFLKKVYTSNGLKILAFALLSEVIWLISLIFLPWRSHVEIFLLLLGMIFAVYFFAVCFILSRETSSRSAILIIGIGLIFRGTAFFAPPTLSDDIYRYLWDGRVQVAGLNPYKYPPDDPILVHLRTPDWNDINHKHIRTIYPPLSQAVFAVGAFVRPTINIQKAIFIGFDVLTSLLLLLLLKKRNLSPDRVLIYSWHPLVIVEFASSGHLDSLAISLLVAGFLLLEQGKTRISGAVWGLGFLAKLGTGMMLPWMILSREGRRLLLPFLVTIGMGYACYALSPLGEWRNFFSSPALYASTWSFNAGLFEMLIKLPFLSPSSWRLVAGLVAIGVAGWLTLKTKISPLAQMGILFSVVLSLSPVVYPWYAIWLVPFLCFYPIKAGFAFTGLVGLSYLVLPRFDSGLGWSLPPWVLAVEYGVPAALLAWEIRKRK